MRRRSLVTLAALLTVTLVHHAHASPNQPGASGGATISVPAGWNLISGPNGSTVSGAAGPLYELFPDETYRTATSLLSGFGYWAYFPNGGDILPPPFDTNMSALLVPAYTNWTSIGNPRNNKPSAVHGATGLLAYAPSRGYYATDQLEPGQGALMMSDLNSVLIDPVGAAPELDCSRADGAMAYATLHPLWLQFADQASLAVNTPRVALAPIVGQLQATRRDWQQAAVPLCARVVQDIGSLYMDNRITEVLDFLGQFGSLDFDHSLAEIGSDAASVEMLRLRFVAGL